MFWDTKICLGYIFLYLLTFMIVRFDAVDSHLLLEFNDLIIPVRKSLLY